VIDAWLAFNAVEPEAFVLGERRQAKETSTQWVTADKAGDFFARFAK
jgi:hypothetical protein